jgi:hypothetical protein
VNERPGGIVALLEHLEGPPPPASGPTPPAPGSSNNPQHEKKATRNDAPEKAPTGANAPATDRHRGAIAPPEKSDTSEIHPTTSTSAPEAVQHAPQPLERPAAPREAVGPLLEPTVERVTPRAEAVAACRLREDLAKGATWCRSCWRYRLSMCEHGESGGWVLTGQADGGRWERKHPSAARSRDENDGALSGP